jgi:transposase
VDVVMEQHGARRTDFRRGKSLGTRDHIVTWPKEDLVGVVIEATFNWYWLVDQLMNDGYRVHLANPAAIRQY